MESVQTKGDAILNEVAQNNETDLKNLRKGGTDHQKDNIVSFIKDVIYK